MSDNGFFSFAKNEIKQGYSFIFEQKWPAWLAGIFLAFLAIIIFLWWHTWGVAGGYRNWGDWFYYLIGLYDKPPQKSPLENGMSVSNIGIILGAFASALYSKQFKINPAPKWEYLKGIIGGFLMGIGAALSAGCNVGAFYSALGMLDLSGFMMMIGLFIGAYIGLKYLLWEMEHINVGSTGGVSTKQNVNLDKIKPFFGFLVTALVIIAFYIYSKFNKTQMGGLLFFGFLIGIVMHRGRFCFANSFREPFMTGDGSMMRAVMMSLMLYAGASVVIKWAYIQPPEAGIYHPYFGALVGGTIFGFGMLLAGGCASGTLWRMGEGHVKLWLTFLAFTLSNSLAGMIIKKYGLKKILGHGIFAPSIFGWPIAFVIFIAVFLFVIIFLKWNEETDKFVVF